MVHHDGRGWLGHPSARWLIGAVVGLALIGGFLAGLGFARWSPTANPAANIAGVTPPASPDSQSPDFALLSEVRGVIESEFYRPDSTNRQSLLYGAARGMVQALGDPNSVYESPAEREANNSRWTGRYEGVGMYVDQRDGQTIITAPIEGGPAQKAGIRPGDVLLEVDGKSVVGSTLNQQTLQIRGPKGTTVVLTVRREGSPLPVLIPIVRDEVRLISARGRLLDNGIGVLRISQFTEGTAEEARTALNSLLAAQPSGLLLDLRANPGGLLEPAVQVAGLFLGGGPVVLEAHANGEEKTYAAPEGAAATDLPMVVLIDKGSASASEVIAAALRDVGRAELLGERTYGKSTVQYIHRLSDGSGLRITVAEWRTASGRPIPATGIEPDWPVAAPSAPPDGSGDLVIDAAVTRLQMRLAAPQP